MGAFRWFFAARSTSLLGSARKGAMLLGPIAGASIAATIGGGWAIALDTLTFFVAAACYACIPLEGRAARSTLKASARSRGDGWSAPRAPVFSPGRPRCNARSPTRCCPASPPTTSWGSTWRFRWGAVTAPFAAAHLGYATTSTAGAAIYVIAALAPLPLLLAERHPPRQPERQRP